MVNRTIVGLVACALISPVPRSYAQQMPESLLRLRPGTTLRVQTGALGRTDGRFLRVIGDTLFLFAQGSETVVGMRDLQVLWQRGRATKSAALVGGLLGAAGAGTFFGLLCGGVDGTCTNRGAAVAFGAATGAAVGVLIGGVIGAAIPKWHRRYP